MVGVTRNYWGISALGNLLIGGLISTQRILNVDGDRQTAISAKIVQANTGKFPATPASSVQQLQPTPMVRGGRVGQTAKTGIAKG